MNFKDAYKSCNDDIKGNREILTSILSGDSKKKSHFNYRPLLACAAMVLIAVSVSVFGFMGGENESFPETSRYIASNDVETEKSAVKKFSEPEISSSHSRNEEQESSEALVSDSGNNQSADASESQSPEALYEHKDTLASGAYGSDVKDENESIKVPEPADVKDNHNAFAPEPAEQNQNREYSSAQADESIVPDETVEYDAATDVMMAYEDSAPDSKAYAPADNPDMQSNTVMKSAAFSSDKAHQSSGGGGAASGSSAAMSNVSSREYYDYIGIDIEKKADLPDDMRFSGAPEISMKKSGGTVVSDSLLIHAASKDNPMRSISIYTSKSNAFSSDENVKIIGDGVTGSAMVCIGGVAVSIDFSNVSADEIVKLAESLR